MIKFYFRFAVENELSGWIDQIEMKILAPILPWISGWPKFNGAYLNIISTSAICVGKWMSQIERSNNKINKNTAIRLKLIHLALSTAVDSRPPDNKIKSHRISCLGTIIAEIRRDQEISSEAPDGFNSIGIQFWDSFVDGPVSQIQQKIQPNRKNTRHVDETRRSKNVKKKVDDHFFFPVILFPDSSDLLSYEVPWNSLSTLSDQTITIGIDLFMFCAILKKWNSDERKLGQL